MSHREGEKEAPGSQKLVEVPSAPLGEHVGFLGHTVTQRVSMVGWGEEPLPLTAWSLRQHQTAQCQQGKGNPCHIQGTLRMAMALGH